MMARKEAEFQAFAREAEQRFLDELMDGLQEYLDQKRASLSDRVEKELSAAERIADATYRPIAHVLSRAVKLKTRTSWNQPFVERILDAELGPEVLTRDLATIAETAKNNFESAWQKKMEESAPNLEMLRALSGSALHGGHHSIGFDLEISTQVFVSGMTAALAGTFALAAGWHTLAYAMANVFPPAAIMTALLGTVTFVLTGKRARENRKERVRKAIEQYHAQLMTCLFRMRMPEFGNKALPHALHELSAKCIEGVLSRWEHEISGPLQVVDFRNVTDLFSRYVTKLNRAACLSKELIESMNRKAGLTGG
jgi:hypothetical protein